MAKETLMDDTQQHVKLQEILPARSFLPILIYSTLLTALYATDFTHMAKGWRKEDYNYCYLVPFIVLYLIWEKRQDFVRLPVKPSWVGVFSLTLGIVFYFLGQLGGEYYTIYISSWFLLIGICWMHLGWRKIKTIAFPLIFILSMFPPPAFVNNRLSLYLKLVSSKLGVSMLQLSGMTAYREGNVIDLGFTKLQVVDACSGLRYLIPLIVLGLLIAYFFKSPFWKKAILVVSTIPISIFTNSLRIASVGFLYQYWGPAVAEGFFHDFSGWFIFMFSFAILIIEMEILKRIFPQKMSLEKQQSRTPAFPETQSSLNTYPDNSSLFTPLRQPHFWCAIICLGVTLSATQGINFREKIPITKSLNHFPLHLNGWSGSTQLLEPKIIEALDFSSYTMIDYKNQKDQHVNFYVAYYESQRKGESIHSPASCLPGGGWAFRQSGTVSIPYKNTHMQVNRALMQKGNVKQLVYYWFPQRGRNLTNAYQLKFFAFWDALTRQRTDGSLVRLITPIYESEQKAEERLLQFTEDVIPTLNTFLPQ